MPSPRFHLVVPLAPRTKKNHSRIVRVKGRPIIIPSAQHEAWFKAALLAVRLQWRALGEEAFARPCAVSATFYRDRATGDLLNYCQALADLLQAAGVVEDDKFIASWDGSRAQVDRERPRIELHISPMEE